MEKTSVEEIVDIFRRLSSKNQAYLMTLVKVAEAAENGVKREINEQICKNAEKIT